MNNFNKVYESIIADMAPQDSILRDVQVGDVYIWLTKGGNTFKVKKGQGTTINRAIFKTVFSSKDEESARNYFHKERSKAIDQVDKK